MIKLFDLLFLKTSHIYDKVKTVIFPLLLAVLSLSASIYVFTVEYINRYIIGGAIWCVFLFAVFTVLPKFRQKIIKPIVHIILLAVSLMLPVAVIGNMGLNRINIYNFIVWFFSGAELQTTRPEYLFGFAVAAGYFFSFTLWYFTSRVYRKQIVFLISLMPYVIFVKAVFPIPYFYVILSVAFNLFIYLSQTRGNIEKSGTVGGRKNMFTVYGDFAIALVLLVFIVPKPSEAPYYEQFQEVLNNYQFGNFGSANNTYGTFNLRSGNADLFNRSQLRDMYYAAMETPNYLKIQSYPYYDAEGNFWYVPSKEDKWYITTIDWERFEEAKNFNSLAAELVRADEINPGFLEEFGAENDLPKLREIAAASDDRLYSAVIQAVDFPSLYIAAPNRTTTADNISNDFSLIRLGGGLFSQSELHPFARTEITYYSDSYPRESEWLSLGLTNSLLFENILAEAQDIITEETGEGSAVLNSFLVSFDYAEEFNPQKNADEVYDNARISELAREITADANNDYEEALALESFFEADGFEYVMGYEPPVGSDIAEYFIFESKTGTCSDFATAFCLMAQSAGLTVRYCEGYIPVSSATLPENFRDTITNPSEQFFLVTSDNAHAYPEVFLGGAWVRFEPTVGSLTNPYQRPEAGGGAGGAADTVVILAVIIAVIIAAAGFVLFLILLPTLREIGFAFTVRFKNPESALRAVYQRTGAYISENRRTMTSGELEKAAKERFGSDISGLTVPFVNHIFGGFPITGEEIKIAYKTYGQFKKDMKIALKKQRKMRKGKK